jgi:predicted MFS family arabinose efflux permease
MIFFSFMLLIPLLPIYLKERFDASNDVIGSVLSGYVVMALVARLFCGYVVDSFPRKKVLVISFAIFSLFFAGYIFAGSLLFFFIVRTLHGVPFGFVTVSNSTVAIDVLYPKRRSEGIGYYGLSNNIATAISPTVALWIYHSSQNYNLIFAIALLVAILGLIICSTVEIPQKEIVTDKQPISLDRCFLLPSWPIALSMLFLSFSYGVVSTYVAIYGQEQLGIAEGAGFFFALLATGLAISRLMGSRSLREGKVTHNASIGCIISLFGYLMFAAGENEFCYFGSAFIIGIGNGHMFPAFQTMFINLASNTQRGSANSSLLVSWDIGVGLGILIGGVVSNHFGYTEAFWHAWVGNLAGVLIFILFAKKYFDKHKLR